MKVGTRLEIDRFLDMLGVFAEFENHLCKSSAENLRASDLERE
jgi:hypothetical protein